MVSRRTREKRNSDTVSVTWSGRTGVATRVAVFVALAFIPPAHAAALVRKCSLPTTRFTSSGAAGGHLGLAGSEDGSGNARPIEPDDLLRLRDFGSLGLDGDPIEVSADGKWAALAIRQGDPDTNSYCTGLTVVDLQKEARAKVIDDTGSIERLGFDMYGMSGIPLGVPKPVLLAWQPGGDLLAYTKTIGEASQIWITKPDGTGAHRLASSDTDIETLKWSDDGSSLSYTSRPAISDAWSRLKSEGLSGFRYDVRFWPLGSSNPYPAGPFAVQRYSLTIDTEALREDTAVAPTAKHSKAGAPDGARAVVGFGADRLAWAIADNPDAYGMPARVHARVSGVDIPCTASTCLDANAIWWTGNGRELIYTRREGTARSQTGMYRWKPGNSSPQRILVTDDVLFGCRLTGQSLLCARETSVRPRHIARIGLHSGKIETVFDPNPEFARVRLGQVRRVRWANSFGIDTFSDLVLPPGYDGKRRLPLVIVQYESRGFLRGGTANEYPIQMFAQAGMAVLSFNRPPAYALREGEHSFDEFLRINQKGWSDRRNILSSLETIVSRLATEGIIDPARVGITGQSDGASTATFGLIHSDLFKAAALSTCCEDETVMATIGEGFQQKYAGMGYPLPGSDRGDFWREGTLLLHPEKKPVPMLIQAGSEEFRMALPTFATLKARGWPIEMYVFPGEGHVKMQPAHQRAVYQRSVEWMSKVLALQPDQQVAAQASASIR